MNVRCPHCHNCLEVVNDDPLTEITCPSCGSQFSFHGDETMTYQPSPVRRIAHFELLNRLGVGHFGAVWMARDSELDRVVAIKIPRKGQLEPEEAEQFLREARAAAQLKHPNIVSVHEVGRDQESIYIVSDFVRGATLSDWMTKGTLGLREAASLCVKIAEALHHAHEKGVIHRDLKPSNIMIDEQGEPHIMDFGLAKREAGEITMTIDGKVLGTPAYMPPEQARGEAHYADRRADVYSLGVILYQLITSELPFRGNSRMLLVQILNEDAPSPRKLVPGLPRDLETITLKCLEKEPSKRYASAEALADELRCWLDGKPINARPSTTLERTIKWAHRRPAVAGLITAVVAVTVVGFAAVFSQWRRAETALVQARSETTRAEDANTKLSESLKEQQKARADADQRRTEAVDAKKEAEAKRTEAEASRKEAADNLREAGRRATLLALERGRTLLEQPVPNSTEGLLWLGMSTVFSGDQDPALLRVGWMNMVTWLPAAHSIRHHLPVVGHASAIAFSPTGEMVAVTASEGGVRMWDANSGTLRWQWPEDPKKLGMQATSVAFSPDGQQLVVGLGHTDFKKSKGAVQRLEAATGAVIGELWKHPDSVNAVVYSRDGKYLFTGCFDKLVRRFDAESGTVIGTPIVTTGRVSSMALSPSGSELAVGRAEAEWSSPPSDVIFIDVGQWQELPLRLKHPAGMKSLAYHPSGKFLATGGDDKTIRIWDLRDGKMLRSMTHTTASVAGVAYSPDGRALVSAGYDYNVRVWNAATGQPLAQPLLQNGYGQSVAFHPNGQQFVTGTAHGASVWDFAAMRLPLERKLAVEGSLEKAMFSADGSAVVMKVNRKSASSDKWVSWLEAWDLETGKPLGPAVEDAKIGENIALRGDKKLMMAPCGGKHAKVWRVEDGQLVAELNHPGATSCAFSADAAGSMIATGGDDNTARVWNGTTFGRIGEPLAHDHNVLSVVFHPDGERLLTGTRSLFQINQFELPSGKKLGDPRNVSGAVSGLVFTPDGKRFASSEFGTWNVRCYKTETSQPVGRPLRHERSIERRLAVSHDSALLATGSDDGFVRLWDIETSQRIGPLLPCEGAVRTVRFVTANDQLELVALDASKSIRRWRIPLPGKPHPDRFRLWTFLITGKYLDQGWGVETLHDIQRKQVSEALAKLGGPPFDLTPDPSQVLNWHRYSAGLCEKEGDGFAAAWHLERWQKLEPTNSALAQRLIKMCLESEDYGAAARMHELQSDAGRAPYAPLFDAALAYAAAHEWESYRRVCRQLMERGSGTEDATLAERLAWICKFGDHPSAELEVPLALVEKSLASNPRSARYHNTYGSLLYRLGKYEESIAAMERAVALRVPGIAQDHFILALAHERLGHAADSKRHLQLAEEQIAKTVDDKPKPIPAAARQEYSIFRKEAELLRSKHDAP